MTGIGDGPIDPRYRQKMNALAKTLDEWIAGCSATEGDRRRGQPG